MKKILKKLSLYLGLPFIACVLVSILYHHCLGDSYQVSLKNAEGKSIHAHIRVMKSYPWYICLTNPIGISYHPLYEDKRVYMEDEETIETVKDDEMLLVFLTRDMFPLTINIEGKHPLAQTITWEDFMEQTFPHIWIDGQMHSVSEVKFKDKDAIVLSWQLQDGEWVWLDALTLPNNYGLHNYYYKDGVEMAKESKVSP